MLRFNFPSTVKGAEKYNCYMRGHNTIFKFFDVSDKNIVDVLPEINEFLSSNGYDIIEISDFEGETSYEQFPVSLSPHGYQEIMILTIERDILSKTQFDFLTEELLNFRDERDWEQFHNPKDLSIALSIESNELLELFLWKKPEEANIEKVKEELADVFAYALLIAEKYNLNVEEIVLDKIKKNAEKYPIEKAKGTVKKYNEL